MIYREQCADYFSKSWNAAEFQNQFNLLMDKEALIGVTKEGFIQLGILEKIGQVLKNFIGGTDNSQKERVQAAWLKFLYYGEAHGYLKDDHIKKLGERISYPYHDQIDPAIKKIFTKLKKHHRAASETQSEYLKQLREIVVEYHHTNSAYLRPGLWKRFFNYAVRLDPTKIVFFGDTPLQLYQKAIKQNNPRLALNYLLKAFDVQNHSPDFQKKLAEKLQNLEEMKFPEVEKRTFQKLWIKLGQTAFENQLPDDAKTYLSNALKIDPKDLKTSLEVVKLYLFHKKYDLAQPLLADIQKAFPNDLTLQIQIGHAYWELKNFDQAVGAYEAALKVYQTPAGKFANLHEIADVYHRLGHGNLKKLIPAGNLTQAVSYLSEALRMDFKVLKYQEDLFDAYEQEWQASHSNFAASHEKNWIEFISKLQDSSLIKSHQKQIVEIFLECGRLHFQNHQNQNAHACLKKALALFEDNIDLKLQVLDMAIQHGDVGPYQSQWAAWEKEYYAHPYLKEKIGDALWSTNKKAALAAYQDSLALFTQKLAVCQDDQNKGDYQKHMADIQARIGQDQLQTKSGLFKGIDYEKAIQNLEKAALLNPENYTSQLFEAHISAAQAEKKQLWAVRNTNNIISHYLKAFQTMPQKGDYLVELIELYLENKRFDEVVSLYLEIQKQPWALDLVLSSATWNDLGKNLAKHKEELSALKCFKRAYKLESTNQKYKQNYFQCALNFTKSELIKIQKELTDTEAAESLEEMAQHLETCLEIGFDKVEKLKEPIKEHLAKIYVALAENTIKGCLIPKPTKQMDKKDFQKHLTLHKDELEQALNYYDQALEYQPANAEIRFDKAALLDWMVEYEKAFSELELVVKNQHRNPFYHKLLGSLFVVIYGDSAKYEQQQELIAKYTTPNFEEDYQIWYEEFMSQVQTKQINPHVYTQQKKGWF